MRTRKLGEQRAPNRTLEVKLEVAHPVRDFDERRNGFSAEKRDDVNESDKTRERQTEQNQKGLRILSDLKGLQNEF